MVSNSSAPQSPPGQPPIRSLLLDRGLNFHGGVTKALLNLARHADPAQLAIEIGSLEPPSPEMLAEFGALRVPVHHLGDAGYFRSAAALRRVLRASGIQLIVSNSLRSYLIAKLAAVGLPVRSLSWVHGISEIVSSGLKARIYQQVSRRDTQIFVSEAVRDANLVASHVGQHHVIYHGVEDPAQVPQWQPYDRSKRYEQGLAQDAQVLIYVASFVGYKDHLTLIRAVDRLRRRHPRLHLLLIGQGPCQQAAQTLTQTLDAQQHVHFLGPRADARALLGLADIYVHPAYPEAFGLAVVEAMLAGLPVAAAADAGPAEIVKDGQTGLLFAPGSVDDLEQKLDSLLGDPALARRLGQAAQLDCTQRFSPQRFAGRMTEVLRAEMTAGHRTEFGLVRS